MAKYDFQFRKSERKIRSAQTQSSGGKMSFTKSSPGVCGENGMILGTKGGWLVGCLPRLIALSGAAE